MVAVPLMATVHPHSFRIAFGVFLAGYALYMLTRHLLIRRPLTPAAGAASVPALSVVGLAAGALGSLTAMPGALMVVWCELRGLSKESQRALVQPFIIAVQIFCHRPLLLAAARDRLRAVSTSRAGAAGGGPRHFHRHVDVLEGERSGFPLLGFDHHPGFGLPDGVRVTVNVPLILSGNGPSPISLRAKRSS
jgi:hypothetical protein